jgi:cytosine/adenosine deaminase-related metal-dependent hydrolase
MRILIAIVLILVLAAAGLYWQLQPPRPLPVPERGAAIDHVTVIQPGEGRRADQTLTIAGSVIGSIAASDGVPGPYVGMYVLPGLINMHAHHPPQNIPVARDLFPLLFLMHGVTTVRDAGDVDGKSILPLRAAIQGAQMPGPRIFACGPFIDGPQPRWENTRVVADPNSAKAVVQAVKGEGYDCLKLYDSLSPHVLAALVAAAKEENVPTIGHVPLSASYPGGIGDVQHFTGASYVPRIDPRPFPEIMDTWASFDEEQAARTVKATMDAGAANTPTLITTLKASNFDRYEDMRRSSEAALLPRFFADVVWHPTEGLRRDTSAKNLNRLKTALPAIASLVKRLHDAGATLHVGTDTLTAFVVPGADMHEEMRLFVEAGIPLEEVWKLATAGNGAALKPGLGRLDAGAPADFLIFGKDPTQDVANLSTLEAVVADGRLYTKADLEQRLARLRDHWSNPVVDGVMTELVRTAMAQFRNQDE